MAKYLSNVLDPAAVPQSEPLPGKPMAKNNAGGYTFVLSPLKQLERFLILGSEGPSYYCSERKLTQDNAKCVLESAKTEPDATIKLIRDISVGGRAPKNDPAIFALALIASQTKDAAFDKVRGLALEAVGDVCRIGTHLFQFIEYTSKMRGWGRGLRNVVKIYYADKAEQLAYDMVKYQNREGWSHKDLLRLAHVKNPTADSRFKWVTKGDWSGLKGTVVEGFERAKVEKDPKEIAKFIREFGLTREMVPTESLNDLRVWQALFEKMPMTAMLRNLNKMTAIGLLTPNGDETIKVMQLLGNVDVLKKARIHPLNVLTAKLTYESGKGQKGSLSWTPLKQITEALEAGFYTAFGAVEPTNKRFFLGLDVSGSMTTGAINGIPGFTPNMAAACMAMVIARTEPVSLIYGFATSFVDLGISKTDSLETAMKKAHRDFGGTDAAVPIKYATNGNIPVDVFVVITDSETWAGPMHSSVALQLYRKKMSINAGLMAIGMTATKFSMADASDPKQVDVAGFDTSVPEVLRWLALS